MIYVCEKCGSMDVQERAWVDVNTKEFKESIDDAPKSFCESCESHINAIPLYEYRKTITNKIINKDE